MTWQQDCETAGGVATVFPYDVPLTQIFPGVPSLSALITVPGFPACRRMNPDGSLEYSMPNLSLSDRYSIVQETLGDEAMASLVGPLQGLEDAANAVAKPFTMGLVLAGAALALLAFNEFRKR